MIKKITLGLLAMAAVLVSMVVALVMSLQAPRMDVPGRNSWVFNDVILVESGYPPRPTRSTAPVQPFSGTFAASTRSTKFGCCSEPTRTSRNWSSKCTAPVIPRFRLRRHAG